MTTNDNMDNRFKMPRQQSLNMKTYHFNQDGAQLNQNQQLVQKKFLMQNEKLFRESLDGAKKGHSQRENSSSDQRNIFQTYIENAEQQYNQALKRAQAVINHRQSDLLDKRSRNGQLMQVSQTIARTDDKQNRDKLENKPRRNSTIMNMNQNHIGPQSPMPNDLRVSQGQIAFQFKQPEHAAIAGAQLILSQYLKLNQGKAKPSESGAHQPSHKKEKTLGEQKQLKAIQESIKRKEAKSISLGQTIKQDIEKLNEIMNSQNRFLPSIGRKMEQKTPTSSTPKPEGKPDTGRNHLLQENPTERILNLDLAVLEEPEKNRDQLIQIIKEERETLMSSQFNKHRPSAVNLIDKDSISPLINNSIKAQELRKIKSFINQFQFKEINIKSPNRQGNFFQSGMGPERIVQISKYCNNMRGSNTKHFNQKQTTPTVISPSIQLPQINNRSTNDLELKTNILTARNSVKPHIYLKPPAEELNPSQQLIVQAINKKKKVNRYSQHLKTELEYELDFEEEEKEEEKKELIKKTVETEEPKKEIQGIKIIENEYNFKENPNRNKLKKESSQALLEQKKEQQSVELQNQKQQPSRQINQLTLFNNSIIPAYTIVSPGAAPSSAKTKHSSLMSSRPKLSQANVQQQNQPLIVKSLIINQSQSSQNLPHANMLLAARAIESSTTIGDKSLDPEVKYDASKSQIDLSQAQLSQRSNNSNKYNPHRHRGLKKDSSSLGINQRSFHFTGSSSPIKIPSVQQSSNSILVQIQKKRSTLKELFSKSKKLPAMTPQKAGQTQRIHFHRRKDMWKKDIVVIVFSEIIGIFDSSFDQFDEKKIVQRLYLRNGIQYQLSILAAFYQVILFLDIRGKDRQQWVKDSILMKEELHFDAIYTFNNDTVSSDLRVNLQQIDIDFSLDLKSKSPSEDVNIEYYKVSAQRRKTLESQLRETELRFEGLNAKAIFIAGQRSQLLEKLLHQITVLDSHPIKLHSMIQFPATIKTPLSDQAHSSFQRMLTSGLEQQSMYSQIEPDLKTSSLLCALRDRNSYIAAEMKKYSSYFNNKYKRISENYDRPEVILIPNQLSSGEHTYYNTVETIEKPILDVIQKEPEPEPREIQITEKEEWQTQIYVIGERNLNIQEDFYIVEQRDIQATILRVINWLCKK